jgi:hypothetical protein
VPKPIKLPWIDSIPKLIYDEYFWVEEKEYKNNERKTRVEATKLNLKKKSYHTLPTMP